MAEPSDSDQVDPRMAAARQPIARVAARALNRQIDWLRLGSHLLLLPIDSRTVHDMRVAARRSRLALRTFTRLVGRDRAAALTEELRWIAGLLAETRDWDIVLGRVKKRSDDAAARLAPDDATLRTALGALAQARADAHARLVDGLASERYAQLVQSLADTVRDLEQTASDDAGGGPLGDFAARRMGRAYKRVRSRLREDIQALGTKRLHDVRSRVRRLRYLVEFFADLGGTSFADVATRLAAAQDALGAAQDAIVAERLLDLLARRAAEGQDGESGLESMLVRLRQDERRSVRRARSKLVRTWRRLPKTLRMLKRALRR
ncbi:MAG: CHAD domain-containing protein [Polyangiaceae bacterium]|nr:CHAD domain-containing protein [Polyangiaceae bacterium]